MILHYCAECGDEFDAVEYREVPAGEDEFCSDPCEDAFLGRMQNDLDYESAGWSVEVF